MWIDTHCHLSGDDRASDRIAEAVVAGVERLVVVGTTVEDSRRAIDLAGSHPGVFATAGVHPHDASGGIEGLDTLLASPDVVAVGECGLDYHYMHSPADEQREVFARQVALAGATGLPLVVHTRDAWDDTVEILDARPDDSAVVIHCFSGGPDEARRLLDLGAWLSFSGIVTFRNAEAVREAARICPLGRLLVETDSPFLAPDPHRGRPNRPALVPVVGEAVAAARGEDARTVATAVWANACTVFGWSADAPRLASAGDT